jgi:hypothetical protein
MVGASSKELPMKWTVLALFFALGTPALAAAPKPAPAKAPESIGTATMDKDGTVRLQLRATGAGGVVGDALLLYPRDHKDYRMILDHLGGLKPGERKPVPPFPDEPKPARSR